MRIKTCCRQRRTSGRVIERVFFAALPFQQQERIGQTNQSDMVVPTRPASTFVVIQPELFLQLLVVLLHAPAQLRQTDQPLQRRLKGRLENQYLVGAFPPWAIRSGPKPLPARLVANMTVSRLDAAGGKTALLRPLASFSPARPSSIHPAARAGAIASKRVGLSL